MDILAARKRAAELAKKQPEPKEAASPQAPASELPAPKNVPAAAASTLPEPAAAAEPRTGEPQPPTPPETQSSQPTPGQEIQTAQEEGGEGRLAGEDAGEAAEEAAVPDLEGLAVRVSSEEYLMPIEQVREVLKIRETTPVPHAPEHAPGVISLRGDILPVVDLGKRLGLPQGTRDEKSRIVVVGLDDEEAGLIVDRVTGVVRYPADAVGPAPENLGHGGGSEYLKGIVRKQGKLYILLDIAKAAGT